MAPPSKRQVLEELVQRCVARFALGKPPERCACRDRDGREPGESDPAVRGVLEIAKHGSRGGGRGAVHPHEGLDGYVDASVLE